MDRVGSTAAGGPDSETQQAGADPNSERLQVEAYQHREAQLREAQRIAGIGSWEWTVGSKEITWSEGLHLILGRDVELGAPPFPELGEWYLPESWDRLGVAIAAAIEHGTPYELEVAMIHQGGGVCWTTTRGEAVRGPDGRVVRLRGTVHDITERKRAAQADREREAQLLEAQRIAGIGSWAWVVGSEEVTWSAGLHLILGRDVSLGPPPFSKLSEWYTPESWERLGVAIAIAIEHGTPYELELAMVGEDGIVRWTTTRGETVRGRDGKVARLRGTVHDITERKRAARADQEREAQLRQAQRIAGIGSWEWEVGRDELTWSEGLHLILGRATELGAPSFADLSKWYAPESWDRLGVAIGAAIDHGMPYELELAMIGEDGEVRWTTTRGEPVRGPDGRVVRLRGTVHDITERKRMQARTAQADRLSSMGLLAAGVAHEINNPLTYVLHNIEILAEVVPRVLEAARRCEDGLRSRAGSLTVAQVLGDHADALAPDTVEETLENARGALEGAERIKLLVRSLSTFSRVENVKETRVDLRHALGSAVNMAHNEMKFRARLVEDLGEVPAVWASEGKLSQVFLNLLINAAHAIDEGDVEHNVIKVRTWAEDDDVFAQVSDTGHGIGAEDLERIFEPFWSSKQVGRGSGLGLAICKNLVTGLDGDIWAESELGKGTRFTVRLPRAKNGAEAQPTEAPAEAPTTRGRLLVVDDEPEIRSMLQRSLGKHHDVVVAASGVEAQQLLRADQAFDVILCDLMMPAMTGMELHEWLASESTGLASRIVFITGGIFTPRAAEYLDGVDNLRVEKPFTMSKLRALIDDMVDENQPH